MGTSTLSQKSKTTWKNRLLLLLDTSIVIVVAYGVGTFIPNEYAKDKIVNNVEFYYQKWAIDMGLNEPSFEYSNDATFVRAMYKCIDFVNFTTQKEKRIPYEMITGMASLETGYGTSRFAKQANNLFSIRTYNQNIPHALSVEYRMQMPMMKELIRLKEKNKLNNIQNSWFLLPKPNEEFYNVIDDPFEINNLIYLICLFYSIQCI